MSRSRSSPRETSSAELDVRPLDAPLGAEVRGLDAAAPPQPGVIRTLKCILAEHGLVVLRDQQLNEEDQQIAFTSAFGDPLSPWLHSDERNSFARVHTLPKRPAYTGIDPGCHYLVNGPGYWESPDDGYLQDWHSDLSYLQNPLPYSVLHALEAAGDAYQTWYSNQLRAYDALDEVTKRKVAGLSVRHDFREVFPALPAVLHPLVLTHPISGRKAIYGLPGFAKDPPLEVTAAEGRSLLEKVTAHLEDEAFIYRHVWRTGDLLIWDNRCVLHRRGPQARGQTRILRRTQAGDGSAQDLRRRLLGKE